MDFMKPKCNRHEDVLVLTVDDEMCSFFLHSDKRQVFDGLRGSLRAGVPSSLKIVEKVAGGRQEARNREAGRREDGTTHDPPHTAEGPPQASQSCSLSNLAAVSTCCPLWFTEMGIYAVVTTAGKN